MLGTGRSYHASPIQQDWIRRAGWCLVECAECGVSTGCTCRIERDGRGREFNIPVHNSRRDLATTKGFSGVHWHTFRHAYRILLIAVGAPLEVRKALLRHADLSTTDDYGGPPIEQKRKAHSGVVRKILSRKSSN
jgi:integrase